MAGFILREYMPFCKAECASSSSNKGKKVEASTVMAKLHLQIQKVLGNWI